MKCSKNLPCMQKGENGRWRFNLIVIRSSETVLMGVCIRPFLEDCGASSCRSLLWISFKNLGGCSVSLGRKLLSSEQVSTAGNWSISSKITSRRLQKSSYLYKYRCPLLARYCLYLVLGWNPFWWLGIAKKSEFRMVSCRRGNVYVVIIGSGRVVTINIDANGVVVLSEISNHNGVLFSKFVLCFNNQEHSSYICVRHSK